MSIDVIRRFHALTVVSKPLTRKAKQNEYQSACYEEAADQARNPPEGTVINVKARVGRLGPAKNALRV